MGIYTIIMVVLLLLSILGGQLYRTTKKQQENEGEAVAGCLYLSVVIPFFVAHLVYMVISLQYTWIPVLVFVVIHLIIMFVNSKNIKQKLDPNGFMVGLSALNYAAYYAQMYVLFLF